MRSFALLAVLAAALVSMLVTLGCGGGNDQQISIAGSSTVFPATRIVVADFGPEHPDINISLQETGSGGGFKVFVEGETSINNSSRPIRESEQNEIEGNDIEFIELPIAYDGLTVVVHPDNPVSKIDNETLRDIFIEGSEIFNWKQVEELLRERLNGDVPELPDEELTIHMRSEASGTYDYFLYQMLGPDARYRDDIVSKSVETNIVARGISGEPWSIGYMGYAFYKDNQDTLKSIALPNADEEYVAPTDQSISELTYTHRLARPLFIYVNKEHAETMPHVETFVDYYLEHASRLIPESGYIPLSDEVYDLVRERWEHRVTGTMYDTPDAGRYSLPDLLNEHRPQQ